MKSIFKYALAAVLAATFYMYSDAKTDIKTASVSIVQDEYRFVDEQHDLYDQTRTKEEILSQNLCPGETDVCALPEESSEEAIMWDGPQNKF